MSTSITSAGAGHRRIPIAAFGLSLGLGESFAFGWYIALVFGPLSNALTARIG